MSKTYRILIVEDERILSQTICAMMEEMGHVVIKCVHTLAKAQEAIRMGGFDIAVLDINLKEGKEGIELGQMLHQLEIPFFYLTSYSDMQTVQLAKDARPGAYVVKPFTERDLFVALEMTAMNLVLDMDPSIIVRKGNAYCKVYTRDIRYMKVENVYVEMHTKDQVWLKRSTLRDLLLEIDDADFIQTHRSYAVNSKYVSTWNGQNVLVGDVEIPISRRMAEDVRLALMHKVKVE